MPDTLAYMIFGYAVIFGILSAYILSLFFKAKKYKEGPH